MALTSKLLKVLVKNNILKLSKLLKSQMWGMHCFFSTFKIEEVESQRSPTHPSCFSPVRKKNWPSYRSCIYHSESCIPSLTQAS